jgi:hypothetical protein
MKQRDFVLNFLAVDNTNVVDPIRLEQGVRYVIGKRYDTEQEADVIDRERGRIVVSRRLMPHVRGFFAKVVRAGELLCADRETADALGVAFKPPPASPADG